MPARARRNRGVCTLLDVICVAGILALALIAALVGRAVEKL